MPSSSEHPALHHPIIVREGWWIIAAIVALCAGVVALSVWLAGAWGWTSALLAAPVAVWSFWFFRDPERATPRGPGVVVSPADGVVCAIDQAPPPPELGLDPSVTRGMNRVCVFMNVFNVHVNRAAAAGRISKIAYRPGKFLNASFDKASEHNERCSLVFDLEDGRKMVIVQIAGLIARRIICRVKEGERLEAGERFGLIRFGSRVDLYLPAGVEPKVQLAQTVLAGLTEVASLSEAPPRSPAARSASEPVQTPSARRVPAGSLGDARSEV